VSGEAKLPPGGYTKLLEFRTALRRFMRWSEAEAKAAGLTPAQHQLLLAIQGHADAGGPTVRELSEYLVLRHHSVVGLIDRAGKAGLVLRERDPEDHRVVHLALTPLGRQRIEKLSRLHLEELRRLGPLLDQIERGDSSESGGAAR
jgi:DNA-binding MarR family transcriptional regulator